MKTYTDCTENFRHDVWRLGMSQERTRTDWQIKSSTTSQRYTLLQNGLRKKKMVKVRINPIKSGMIKVVQTKVDKINRFEDKPRKWLWGGGKKWWRNTRQKK